VKKTPCEKAIFGASLVGVVGPHSSWQFEIVFSGQQADHRLKVVDGAIASRASGSYGLIRSSLNDGLILPAYARTGVYEPRLAALFCEFFASQGGGTYLDIGANIGLTTIPADFVRLSGATRGSPVGRGAYQTQDKAQRQRYARHRGRRPGGNSKLEIQKFRRAA
jgi:hypothetical protein